MCLSQLSLTFYIIFCLIVISFTTQKSNNIQAFFLFLFERIRCKITYCLWIIRASFHESKLFVGLAVLKLLIFQRLNGFGFDWGHFLKFSLHWRGQITVFWRAKLIGWCNHLNNLFNFFFNLLRVHLKNRLLLQRGFW